jgi:pimeloyl-ACP methyl ester carboxylesterase
MPENKKIGTGLQGIIRLITEATIGITDLVEAMNKRIVHPPLLPSTPIQHFITAISEITYKNIRWSTKFIGNNLDKALGPLTSVLGEIKTTNEREALNSVLNGVIGDYLEENENPLRIYMQFRYQAKAISLDSKSLENTYRDINGKILLMVHGSCMNDIQWTRKEHNHGLAIAKELHKTPIFLHYNSGRNISTNGQNFNDLLEQLVLNWPVPVQELTILSHSMGGLVARSAIYYGHLQGKSWTKQLRKIVFLGTPHHGAPLEQAGNYLDIILENIPYAKPFARLGKIRSAGVTDLRYGNLIDEDWLDSDRFKLHTDKRQNVPLLEHVSYYSIAGVAGKEVASKSFKWLGDNMVSVKSALGQHKNPDKDLNFKKENTWIAFENSHTELLSSPEVYIKVKDWLTS